MAGQFQGRMGRLQKWKEWQEWALLAKAQTGKSLLQQAREIMELRSAGGGCGVTDYYWFKLYDDDYLKGRGAKDFLGRYMLQPFSEALNPRKVVYPAWDKLTFSILATAVGLPVVPIKAYFHRLRHDSPSLGIHLANKAAVGKFLRDPANYPLFGKPSYAQLGLGGAYLDGYNKSDDCIILLGGNTITVDDFLQRIDTSVHKSHHKLECGFLFQTPLIPAEEIHTLTNWKAICGVRVTCLNGPEGARPIGAVWKLATAPNHMDNFSLGRYGNLLADIDLDTGEVTNVINGLWPTAQEFKLHPTTGLPFAGIRIPNWDQILDACKLGGAAFPLMQIHHWDFALTNQGPKILEVNDLGGIEILQVHGKGLLTEENRDFLKRYGNLEEHPWIEKL